MKFSTRDIVATLGVVEDDEVIELVLRGNLLDGTREAGSDCVVIKGVGKK